MTMERKSAAVNTRRRYDSSGRRERARQARDQIAGIAEDLFLSRGYAATTVAAIAAQARVSVETIYKGFGGKPGLVRAIVERGLAGAGPVPAEQRSDQIRDTVPDPRQILAAWGAFVTEIAPRTAPILTLARDAAASDPELAALLDEISAARHPPALDPERQKPRAAKASGCERSGPAPTRHRPAQPGDTARPVTLRRTPMRCVTRVNRPVCAGIGSYRSRSLARHIWLIRSAAPGAGRRATGWRVLPGCCGREQGSDHGLRDETAVVLRWPPAAEHEQFV